LADKSVAEEETSQADIAVGARRSAQKWIGEDKYEIAVRGVGLVETSCFGLLGES
jgi:phage protein U